MTKQISGWTLCDLISDAGGNGQVWRVTDPTGGEAALKMLRSFSDVNKAEKRRGRFISEIKKLKLASELGIHGVMPVLEHGVEGDQLWFAMPIAQQLEPPDAGHASWVLSTMISISATIAALHEHGIVHRDIKPSNLLVLAGDVLVSDFGLAYAVDDDALTRTSEGVGSFGYMAPEAVGHSDEPQFKLDVYSLGKTAWTLFTRSARPPQHELTSADTLLANGVDGSDIPLEALNSLLVCATSRDPGDRPTARQFLDGLKACLPGQKPPAKQTSALPEDLAASLFRESAAKNRRDLRTNSAFSRLYRNVADEFSKNWRSVAANIGWSSNGHGGSCPDKLRPPDWKGTNYWYFAGEIEGQQCTIKITFLRRPAPGELRLECEAVIYVEVNREVHVVKSAKMDTFIDGPAFEQSCQRLLELPSDRETQFRAIQMLHELTRYKPAK